ncbi:hypothetical protein [Amycolatopsis sp. NPDC054798]
MPEETAEAPAESAEDELREAAEWKDGRLVAIRPEIRNSVLEKSYILRTEEQKQELERTMGETVARRRAMSPEQKKAELREIAVLAGEEL